MLAAVGAEGTQGPATGPGALEPISEAVLSAACSEWPKSGSKMGVLLAVDCASASGLASGQLRKGQGSSAEDVVTGWGRWGQWGSPQMQPPGYTPPRTLLGTSGKSPALGRV